MARAGTIPSNSLMEMYTTVMDPENVRVDHIYINRVTDKDEHVTGAHLSGSKIGGDISDAIMIIPDPMGATGSSINQVLDYYKKNVTGKPKGLDQFTIDAYSRIYSQCIGQTSKT
jgi:uracil phosphoribosyltransferase